MCPGLDLAAGAVSGIAGALVGRRCHGNGDGVVTATIDEPRGGKVKSGFMLRRHLAIAPPLRLGRSAAWPGRRGGVED